MTVNTDLKLYLKTAVRRYPGIFKSRNRDK